MKNNEIVQDAFLLTGLAGMGAGVYHVWGTGWALIVVSAIMLSITIMGELKR